MEVYRKDVPIVAPEFRVENKSGQGRIPTKGTMVREVAVATYDVSGGVDSGAIGSHGLGVYLPDNAVVTNVVIDVITTFVTASADAGTIAVQIQAANDVVSAIAVSDATNVWDAGIRGTKIGSFSLDGNALTQVAMAAARAASCLKLTADREITVVTGGQVVSAGKMNIYVEYFVGS